MSDSNQPNYNAAFYARLFDVTERRIQQLAKAGIIPRAGRGKYPLIGTIKGYIKFLQERALEAEQITPEDFIDPAQERAKLDQAKREHQELINDKLSGNQFPIDVTVHVVSSMGAEVAGIMDSLPAKVKRVCPGLTATGMDVMKKEMAKARNAAADVAEKIDEYIEEHYSEAEKEV